MNTTPINPPSSTLPPLPTISVPKPISFFLNVAPIFVYLLIRKKLSFLKCALLWPPLFIVRQPVIVFKFWYLNWGVLALFNSFKLLFLTLNTSQMFHNCIWDLWAVTCWSCLLNQSGLMDTGRKGNSGERWKLRYDRCNMFFFALIFWFVCLSVTFYGERFSI